MSEETRISQPEPFELEVQSSSFSLKIRGFRPIAQVGAYLADFIGLIGEPAGAATDALKRFRIHRAESAAAAMLRAKQIAADRGETIGAVSPKILAPWIEGASLEEIDDENILELWAQILAASDGTFDPVLAALIELASKIGPREALLLRDFFTADLPCGFSFLGSGSLIQKSFGREGMRPHDDRVCDRLADRLLRSSRFFHDLDSGILDNWSLDEAGAPINTIDKRWLDQLDLRLFARIGSIGVFKDGGGFGLGPNIVPLEVLEFYGVVARREKSSKTGSREIKVMLFELTHLGLKFFELLNKNKLKVSGSFSMDKISELMEWRRHRAYSKP